MSDPYKVLGIDRNATDDEVKTAYRKLSRKYHPDANINNPNKEKAEEMFKLVQQAYDQIMNERKNGGYSTGNSGYDGGSSYGGFGGFGNFGGFGGYGNGYGGDSYGRNTGYGREDSYYTAATNYINNGRYHEALNVLNNINDRNAQWYFLSALANNGVGNNILALDMAKTALRMEPDNASYQRLVQTLESGGQWYNERQYSYGGDRDSMFCCSDPCTALCLMNLCCHC